MQLEDFFEFIGPDDIRIKGHRIGIESILNLYLAGHTAEEIADQFHTLRLLDIYATITYYLQNKAAIDVYLERTKRLVAEDMARSDASPPLVVLRLRKLREERAKAGV